MDRFFIFVYHYFNQRKNLFWILTVLVVALLGWGAACIKLEEDLTKSFPNHIEFEKINYVFKNSSFGEKIVVMISAEDTTRAPQPDSLVAFAEAFADSINRYSSYVHPVDIRIDFSKAEKFLKEMIRHLPVFLEEADYIHLDSITQTSSAKEIIQRTYSKLNSPLSLYPKRMLVQDPLGFTAPVLKRLAAQLYDENYLLYDNCIVTKDYKHLIFFVQSIYPANETGHNSKLLAFMDAKIDEINKLHVGISAAYFGPPVVAASNANQLRIDSRLTLAIMVALLGILFGTYFRNLKSVFIIFIPVVGGAAFSLALIFLLKGSISVLAVAAGSIVLGIAVNYSLHFLVHARYSKNAEEVILQLTGPLTLGNATTVLAFLFLQLANAEVLRDIGLFAAFSLIGAALCSLVVLPQMWHMVVKFDWQPKAEKSSDFLHRSWFLVALLFMTILLAYWAPQVKFNSDMNALSFMNEKTKEAQNKLETIQGGVWSPVFVVSEAKSFQAAIRKNETLNQTFGELKENGIAKKINSVSSFLISDSLQQIRINRWNSFWNKKRMTLTTYLQKNSQDVPTTLVANAIASFTKEYKVVSDSSAKVIGTALFADQIIERDGNYSMISILTVPISQRSKVTADLNASGFFAFNKSSAAQMIVSFVKDDFNLILGISSMVVFLALWIAYKRIEMVLISFFPMLITWIWILGIMAILKIEFNMINVMISTFIFGLGDDYSIFVMDGLQQEYAGGKKSLDTINISIVLSALTTIAGLGVLIFALHPALRSIALISIIGIICVFTMSQTVGPFLFHWLTRQRTERELTPRTLRGLLNSVMTYFLFVTGSLTLTIFGLFLFLVPLRHLRKRLLFHQMICVFARALIYVGIRINWEIMEEAQSRFSKPSIIVVNHSSFLDILLTVMLHPKLVLFTNRWVWNSPIFGGVVRLGGYLTVQNDFQQNLQRSRQLLEQGYSIVIFPEGSRSANGEIKRFHKGAFLLAEELNADIQPLLIYGACDTIRKNELYVSENRVALSFLQRIKPNDSQWGSNPRERAKSISQYFRTEKEMFYKKLNAAYFHPLLIANYRYKGAEAEREAQKVISLIDFDALKKLLPTSGNVFVLDSDLGAVALMLHFMCPVLFLIGVDRDSAKIELANQCYSKKDNLQFASTNEIIHGEQHYDSMCVLKENSDWIEHLKYIRPKGTIIFFHPKNEEQLKTYSTEHCLFYKASGEENKFVVLTKED